MFNFFFFTLNLGIQMCGVSGNEKKSEIFKHKIFLNFLFNLSNEKNLNKIQKI